MKISLLFLLICVAAATATVVGQYEQNVPLPSEASSIDFEPVSDLEYDEDDDEIPADDNDDADLNEDLENSNDFWGRRRFSQQRKQRDLKRIKRTGKTIVGIAKFFRAVRKAYRRRPRPRRRGW